MRGRGRRSEGDVACSYSLGVRAEGSLDGSSPRAATVNLHQHQNRTAKTDERKDSPKTRLHEGQPSPRTTSEATVRVPGASPDVRIVRYPASSAHQERLVRKHTRTVCRGCLSLTVVPERFGPTLRTGSCSDCECCIVLGNNARAQRGRLKLTLRRVSLCMKRPVLRKIIGC